MLHTISLIPLSATAGSNLDSIGKAITTAGSDVTKSIVATIKTFFDTTIVPLALIALVVILFFLIFSISNAKKKREGEGLEEKTQALLICLALFIVIGAYGVWGGNLVDTIISITETGG